MTARSKNWLTYRPIDTWPGTLRSDSARATSDFTATWTDTLALLEREVGFVCDDPRGAYWHDVVIQLAVPEGAIRQDGQLNNGAKDPEHPGVIVTINDAAGGPLRMATDKFRHRPYGNTLGPGWRHNVRAIALALEALRRVDRYGIGQGHEQYVGYQAIGTGTPMGQGGKLTIPEAFRVLNAAGAPELTIDQVDADKIRDLRRELARHHHPDRGGDAAVMESINLAVDTILEVL